MSILQCLGYIEKTRENNGDERSSTINRSKFSIYADKCARQR